MFKWFCRQLFKLQGWSIKDYPPENLGSCVLVGAPHTSNWDFFHMIAVADFLQVENPRFTIKQEWVRFPFNLLLEPLGALAIDRSPKQPGQDRPSMVDCMAEIITSSDEVISLLVTPEGTRSPVERWRTGFYQIALKAEVPILLGYLDYKKREAGIGRVIHPSGDMEKDLRQIWDFYNTITPKHPEKYRPM